MSPTAFWVDDIVSPFESATKVADVFLVSATEVGECEQRIAR